MESKVESKKRGFAQIPVLVGLLLVSAALPAALKLVQQAQKLRREARISECAPGERKCEGSYYYRICQANGQWSQRAWRCPSGYKCEQGSCRKLGRPTPTPKPRRPTPTPTPRQCKVIQTRRKGCYAACPQARCPKGYRCEVRVDSCGGRSYVCTPDPSCKPITPTPTPARHCWLGSRLILNGSKVCDGNRLKKCQNGSLRVIATCSWGCDPAKLRCKSRPTPTPTVLPQRQCKASEFFAKKVYPDAQKKCGSGKVPVCRAVRGGVCCWCKSKIQPKPTVKPTPKPKKGCWQECVSTSECQSGLVCTKPRGMPIKVCWSSRRCGQRPGLTPTPTKKLTPTPTERPGILPTPTPPGKKPTPTPGKPTVPPKPPEKVCTPNQTVCVPKRECFSGCKACKQDGSGWYCTDARWCKWCRKPECRWWQCSQHKNGDANCNGKIEWQDVEIWRQEYFETNAKSKKGCWQADFNHDKKVTLQDLEIWRQEYFGG